MVMKTFMMLLLLIGCYGIFNHSNPALKTLALFNIIISTIWLMKFLSVVTINVHNK